MAITLPIISEWNPKGIDKAINDFKKLETNGQKAAFAIKKAAVPAGLALAAMGAFAFDAVKAFAEDDAAAQKLATTLGNVTGATDAQVASVEDFITKTSIAAAVADDELRPALDKLVRGTGDVTKAQDLLGLALDISAGTGKDLGAVSDALSKAFNGNLGPLKKLDPALADLVANGASAEEVFAALGKTFSGQASTAANTTSGKMKTLSIQMGELKESIGAAVLPLVEKMLPALGKFATWAQENPKLITILAAAMGILAASIVAVNIAMALNPFVAVAAAVAVLAAGLAYLWVKFDDLRPLIFGLVTGPFGLMIAAFIYLKNAADDVLNFVINLFKTVFNWAKNNWPLLLAILTGPFGLAFAAILHFKDSVIGVFNGLKDLAATIFNGIGAAYKGVINAVISTLEKGLNFAIKGLNTILDGIDKAAGPWVNFGSIPEVNLPRLAEGGIVTSPTIAMIGEGREPEAVIPLSKLGSMGFGGGGGGNITINVTSADPNEVVRALQAYNRNVGRLPVSVQ
jgi:hypothetical protein